MRIECPCCGLRDVGEFAYLGDAAPVRPEGLDAAEAAMADYVYLRGNPAGVTEELWYHTLGCRAWLVVARDTRTHAIERVGFARERALQRREAGAAA